MKIPTIQITFLLIAIAFLFTTQWIWALVILFHIIVYRTNRAPRYKNATDDYV
jgi:hypothetical protein